MVRVPVLVPVQDRLLVRSPILALPWVQDLVPVLVQSLLTFPVPVPVPVQDLVLVSVPVQSLLTFPVQAQGHALVTNPVRDLAMRVPEKRFYPQVGSRYSRTCCYYIHSCSPRRELRGQSFEALALTHNTSGSLL